MLCGFKIQSKSLSISGSILEGFKVDPRPMRIQIRSSGPSPKDT